VKSGADSSVIEEDVPASAALMARAQAIPSLANEVMRICAYNKGFPEILTGNGTGPNNQPEPGGE